MTITVRSQSDIPTGIPGLSREDVVWKRDGEPIDFSTGNYQVLADGSLRILSVSQTDGGLYTILVPKLDLGDLPAAIVHVTVEGNSDRAAFLHQLTIDTRCIMV